MVDALILFGTAAAIALAVCTVAAPAANAVGLIDMPGGRKSHAVPVPLVGGLAIFAAAVSSLLALTPLAPASLLLLVGPAVLLAIGVVDDGREIRPRFRFAAQIIACACVMYVSGVQLRSVGDLLGIGSIGLWIFIIPATIFAVVGVINAVNMIDGIDGLAGSVALVALAWYGVMADLSGMADLVPGIIALGGATAGFLLLNFPVSARSRARVFLGDAGSTLLGFVLGWLALALTQRPGSSVPPICALWVVLLPLADTVSVMARRIRRGVSPFVADREHIHHLLGLCGLSRLGILGVLASISALFGAVGFFGWRFAIPQSVLFATFFVLFFAYHFVMERIWGVKSGRGAQQPVEVGLSCPPQRAAKIADVVVRLDPTTGPTAGASRWTNPETLERDTQLDPAS